MAQPEQASPSVLASPTTPASPSSVSRVSRAPPKPASVKINVEGAFIVNDETVTRNGASEFVHWEQKDIRLPHHTDVVSHIAIDVSFPFLAQSSRLTRTRLAGH